MYRIEVAPGEETVFRTIDELAVGIRNGVITPRSRIYHNASQKWLPIGLHPHYKKALALPAASAAHPATPTPVPAAPRIKPPSESGEHPAIAKASAPEIPAPVTSPIVAMQREVLRDLPVVAIPEPLPWTAPPRPSPPTGVAREPATVAVQAAAVQSQPAATMTYAPLVFPEPGQEPAQGESGRAATKEIAHHARPTARRSVRGGGRPLAVVGVAAALVVAGHFALAAMRSRSAEASASRSAVAAPEPAMVEPAAGPRTPSAGAGAAAPSHTSERVSSASARVPMTPGPAFAGSAPVSPGGSPTPRAPAPAPAPAPATASAAASPAAGIAPGPVQFDLAIPNLAGDSLVPAPRAGDSMAMKKILRALNGAKPTDSPTAP